MEHGRSMRLNVGFSLQLLVDFVDNVVQLINRGPSSSLDGGIPKEVVDIMVASGGMNLYCDL
jgi:hypothetical protein